MRYVVNRMVVSTLAAGMLSLAGCQMTGGMAPMNVPASLKINGPVILTAKATGDQIYTWDASARAWKLTAPDATFTGRIPGRHYAGPAWVADDGSTVRGEKIAEAPAPDPSAIPWLLVKSIHNGGSGILTAATYIQRINTTGGLMPTAPGSKNGEEERVPYTATYIFYGIGAKPAGM